MKLENVDCGTVMTDENVALVILISEGFTIGDCNVKENVVGSIFDPERKTKNSDKCKLGLGVMDISRRNTNSGTKKGKENTSTFEHPDKGRKIRHH